MNKPLSMIVEETKNGLASVCNESGLPPIILDFILKEIYYEVHNIAEKQALHDKSVYEKSLNDVAQSD